MMNLQFATADTIHKLTCGWYKDDGRTASTATFTLNDEHDQRILNPNIEPVDSGGLLYNGNNLQFFSLEKKIHPHRLNNRDWIISVRLHEPRKLVSNEIFMEVNDGLQTNLKNSQNIYAAWLINQIHFQQADTLEMITWTELYSWFSRINSENPCTVLISDGQDIVAYQGSNFSNALYYLRSCPPRDEENLYSTGDIQFHLESIDLNHTFTMLSNNPIQHMDSTFLNLNQMLVVRAGEVIWNNDPNSMWHKKVQNSPQEVTNGDLLHKVRLQELRQVYTGKKNQSIAVPTDSLDTQAYVYSVLHESSYVYESPIFSSSHLFRMQPVSDLIQGLLQFELSVLADGVPVASLPSNFIGAFGNNATYIEIQQPYTRLDVICKSTISLLNIAPKRLDLLHQQRNIPLIWMPWDRIMMQAYLVPPELPESELMELSDYALSFVKRNNNDVYEVLKDINRTIHNDFKYVSGSTNLYTTPYEVYAKRRGVCQDFANLFICLARLLNIPARYRTGYIYTATDYANQAQGDASHAWLEVFLPYVGWQGYDPTNYCIAEKNHIRVACGRTYTDTAPTSGTIYRGGGNEELVTSVKVIRLDRVNIDQ